MNLLRVKINPKSVQAAIDAIEKVDEGKISGHLFYNLYIFYTNIGSNKQARNALNQTISRDANFALGYFQLGLLEFQHSHYQGKCIEVLFINTVSAE